MTILDQACDQNDYLFWYHGAITLYLHDGINRQCYELYDANEKLNNRRHCLIANTTVKEAKEEQKSLDEIIEKYEHYDESD